MIKGINQDFTPENTPEGFGFYAKNVVGQRKYDALLNEKGTTIPTSLALLNVKDFIGEIVFQSKLVIFYKNTGDADCIAVIDEDAQTVQERVNRADLLFNKDFPITGRAKLNSKGDLIIAFTDKKVSPKYINLTTADASDKKEIYELFLVGEQPDYNLSVVDNGGNVSAGVYFVTIKYIDKNKSSTDWTVLSHPIYITTPKTTEEFADIVATNSGVQTNKAIKIELSNLDTAFTDYSLGFIAVVGEVVKAFKVKDVEYTGSNSTVVYSGAELTTLLTVEEVLTKNFNFDSVDAITALSDALYVAGGYITSDTDLQILTNTLHTKMKWESTLVSAPFNHDGNQRTLMHGEVYALYARYYLNNKWTKWFHIPGRAATAAEKGTGLEAGGLANEFADSNPRIYKYDDTCTLEAVIGSTGARGLMGAWENEDETYSSDFPELAGQKVRHHKMPSMDFMKKNAYTAAPYYGIRQWDKLYLTFAFHTTLPDEYKGKITKLEIGYAKRDEASTTVFGYDIPFLMGKRADFEEIKLPTGGNWGIDYVGASGNLDIDFLGDATLSKLRLRMHCPDILINKPNITDIYLEYILKTNSNPTMNTPSYAQNAFGSHESSKAEPYGKVLTGDNGNMYIFLSNFLQFGSGAYDYNAPGFGTPTTGTLAHTRDKRFVKLNRTKYLPRAVRLELDSTATLDNFKGEEVLYGEINNTYHTYGYPIAIFGNMITHLDDASHLSNNLMEEVILCAIKAMRSNVFNSYLAQRVVPLAVGEYISAPISTQGELSFDGLNKGDAFICAHSFLTLAPINATHTTLDDPDGVKCMKLFLCESRYNLNQRYQETGDFSTYFFPSGAYYNGSIETLYWQGNIIQASSPVNVIKLSKDFSQENIFDPSDIFNHSVEVEDAFPHIIIRSEQGSRETGIEDGWRTFKPNNYFYTIRDRGKIINLESISNDSLLIHHESGLFRTRGNVVLQAGINDISLGKGDIFEIEPKEVSTAAFGYGGTRHKFSCALTEVGYFFADAERGEIFLYDFSNLVVITKGFRNELFDYLTTDPLAKNFDNPYQGKGISIGYDSENYRVLFSLRGATSFTLSYDLLRKEWLCGHDYKPNKLLNTRKSLYSVYNNELYKHNTGARGNFYGTVYPSFVDVVINSNPTEEKILDAIRWITKVVMNGGTKYDETITHITIWNEHGSTGKITLTEQANSIYDIQDRNLKNYDNVWQFDEIMDIVKTHTEPFVDGFTNDYRPIPANLDNSLAWYEKLRLRGKYFIVRLEYSNFQNKEVYLQKLLPQIKLSQ